MKKVIALVFFVILTNTFATPQFGFKFSLGTSTITGDDTENLTFTTAYSFGLSLSIPVEEFYIQPEFSFAKKGASFEKSSDFGGSDNTYIGSYELYYLDIPLLFSFPLNQQVHFYIGPKYSILLSHTRYVDERTLNGNKVEVSKDLAKKDLKENTTGYDFGIVTGLTVYLTENFNLSARINYGITNTNDYEYSDDEVSNLGYDLVAGIYF